MEFHEKLNQKNRAESLSQKAYSHIRREIISLRLPPGAVIDENELKDSLEMGRTPIREALQRLALEKLVTILPRRGMFVTEISIADLQRLFEIRLRLEGLAAELAAVRGTPEHFEKMDEVLAQLPCGNGEDVNLLIAIDEAFHWLIYEATDNPFLQDTLNTLYALSLRLWYFSLSRIGGVDQAVREHQEILKALKAGDGLDASRLLRQHIQTFQEKIHGAVMGGVFAEP